MEHASHFKGRAPVPAQLIQQERLELVQWIAFLAMIADHVGVFLFPKIMYFRMLGRIAFPMFAFVFAWRLAFSLDKNPKHNVLPMTSKLLMSGLAAQFIWSLVGFGSILNIMFVFFSCLMAIVLTNEENPFLGISAPFRWAFVTLFLYFIGTQLDNGYLGLAMILGTYGFLKWGNVESLIFGMISYFALDYNSFTKGTVVAAFVVLMVLKSPFFVGKKIPNFFYWAYPLHLLGLLVIAVSLNAVKTFN